MSAPHAGRVVLELRVHGVRGTPVASMLGVDASEVEQVAGDSLTGFHRIKDGADPPLRRLPHGMALEAYSWGALTSGARSVLGWIVRALWLVLLPSALVNMAYWARIRAGRNTLGARVSLRAVRLSGLLLTVLGMVTSCFVAMDLVAWQCFRAHSVACPVLPDWLDMAAGWTPGQRIAAMSLVPLGVLGVLGVLVVISSRSLRAYEAVVEGRTGALASAATPRTSVLEHRLMWSGESRTRRLQRIHVAAALVTIVLFSGLHVLRFGEDVTGVVISTSAAAVLGVVVVWRSVRIDTDDLEHPDAGAAPRAGSADLPWLALTVTVLHGWGLLTSELTARAEEADWFGADWWFLVPFGALVVLHLAVFACRRAGLSRAWIAGLAVVVLVDLLAVVLWWHLIERHRLRAGAVAAVVLWVQLLGHHVGQARRRANRQVAWGGAGASVLLGAATMVSLLFASATTVAAAELLNGSEQSVPDLVTTSPDRPRQLSATSPRLTLRGDVELVGARVLQVGEVLRITSGTVRAERVVAPAGPDAASLPSTVLLRRAELSLAAGAVVRLERSCVGPESRRSEHRDRCTAESPGFTPAGELVAPAGRLDVETAGGRVKVEMADPPQAPLVLPQILVWTPLLQAVLLVVGALVTLGLVVLYRVRAGRAIAAWVPKDPLDVPASARSRVADARVTAGLAHRGEALVGVVGTVVSLLCLVTFAVAWASAGLVDEGVRAPWVEEPRLRPLATASLWAAFVTSAGLVALGAQVRRSPSARRNVGVLWDLATFWPRSAHPFAPPCYAERVVPEVVARVRWALADDPDRVVVLSGHSQGSLIVVAVASRLRGCEERLRLLTYGSQVRALYGRVFPAAAGPDVLGYVPTAGPVTLTSPWPDVPDDKPAEHPAGHGLRGRLGNPDRWVNLFRRGDPLGFPVHADARNEFDVATLEVRPAREGDPASLVLTHGGYQHSPEYRRVIARWTGEAFQCANTGPAEVDPLPPS